MNQYLLDSGTQNVEVQFVEKGKKKWVSGSPIKIFVKKFLAYQQSLYENTLGRDHRVVEALLVKGIEADQLTKKADVEKIRKAISEFIQKAHPEIHPVVYQVEEDKANKAFKLITSSRDKGVRQDSIIDTEFLNSEEFTYLKKRAAVFENMGEGPYSIKIEEEAQEIANAHLLVQQILDNGKKGLNIQRYKGLGEMNPGQLWETTMDPDKRSLLKVTIEDAAESDDIFSVLMGDAVDPRRNFIESNALAVKNLDI